MNGIGLPSYCLKVNSYADLCFELYSLVYAVPRTGVSCSSASITVEELTTTSGSIKSPNYPSNYYNNAAYGWRVTAKSADMVSIVTNLIAIVFIWNLFRP